jgi:hypothetical protein
VASSFFFLDRLFAYFNPHPSIEGGDVLSFARGDFLNRHQVADLVDRTTN